MRRRSPVPIGKAAASFSPASPQALGLLLVTVALKPLPPLQRGTAVSLPHTLLPSGSGTKISFSALCLDSNCLEGLKILEKKEDECSDNNLGNVKKVTRTQLGKSLSCRLMFSATTQPVATWPPLPLGMRPRGSSCLGRKELVGGKGQEQEGHILGIFPGTQS